MSLYTIFGAFDLGCIFAILSLGLFISYKVLNIADMTVDGSFALGCAISGVLTVAGHPFLAILAGTLGGCLAGIVSGTLQTRFKIQSILAGILTMTALYSINLRILGNAPSLSLFGADTIFTPIESYGRIATSLCLLIILIVLSLGLIYFLKTLLGLSLRATGDNETMVRASSINTDQMKIIGLAIANSFVGLAGAIMAQYQCFADVTSGTGTLVIALASIILGEAFLNKTRIEFKVLSVCFGALFYRYLLTFALQLGFNASDLKLLSAILVAIAISLPSLTKRGDKHAR